MLPKEVKEMKSSIGFIGAGKVGCSLGQYFADKKCTIRGYYSKSLTSATEAAKITNSLSYGSIKDLVLDSDIVFITTTDESIVKTLEIASSYANAGTCFCHCSGALSCEDIALPCCSLHPMLAVPNKHSAKLFTDCIFTVEGRDDYFGTQRIYDLMLSLKSRVIRLNSRDKTLYHIACVTASNLVIGLLDESINLLIKCGFDQDTAFDALKPLFFVNTSSIIEKGITNALTGPIERNDISTVQRHLNALDNKEDKTIYKILSKHVLKVAKQRNPKNNYKLMEEILK